uniref:Uncharacterized protein n=1 Tax=Anguilla anguilla TaxID=7936 RepID=A0A0E9XP14_ANGAN
MSFHRNLAKPKNLDYLCTASSSRQPGSGIYIFGVYPTICGL